MGVPGLYGAFHSLFGDQIVKMPISKIDCDAVFFDMNNVLHQSVPPWQEGEDDEEQEKIFFSNVYNNTIRKVSEVLSRIVSLNDCAVYFLIDGCSSLAKTNLQRKRRQYLNFRKHLLPETRTMSKIEKIMEKVARELGIPRCFISPSSVPGENDCKVFAICSELTDNINNNNEYNITNNNSTNNIDSNISTDNHITSTTTDNHITNTTTDNHITSTTTDDHTSTTTDDHTSTATDNHTSTATDDHTTTTTTTTTTDNNQGQRPWRRRRVMIVSRDYDFLVLSLLRIHLFEAVYVYFSYHKVTDVSELARTVVEGYRTDLRLFVLASFVFGNDFAPKYCTVTRQTLISLLTFLRGSELSSAAGVRLKLTSGTHFWPDYGKSYRVIRFDREKFKSFFDRLLAAVRRRPAKREVDYDQLLWTFKYYLHDRKLNLVSSSRSIYNTAFNRAVLHPLTLHHIMGTVSLYQPQPSKETPGKEDEMRKLPYYKVR